MQNWQEVKQWKTSAVKSKSAQSLIITGHMLRRPAQDARFLGKMRAATRTDPRYGHRYEAIEGGISVGHYRWFWRRYDLKIVAQRTHKPHPLPRLRTDLLEGIALRTDAEIHRADHMITVT